MRGSERRGRAPRALSRRDFLKRAGVVGVATAVPGGVLVGDVAAVPEREQREAFTAAEAETVEAIVQRLIPTDANGPGAAEARVARFIDRALGGELSNLAGFYSAGLAATDAYAQSRFGGRFAGLMPAQQDAVLTALETNAAPGFVPSSADFFNTVREHALQGMFGDPFYGGNADFIGWDLIGFPGIKLNFLPKEQELDVNVKAAHKSTADYPLFGHTH